MRELENRKGKFAIYSRKSKFTGKGEYETKEIIEMFATADSGAGPQYFDGIGVSMTSNEGVGNFYFIAFDSEETFNKHISESKE